MSNNLIMMYNGPPIKWKTDKQADNRSVGSTLWKTGQSGNPNGRSPGNSPAVALRKLLETVDGEGRVRVDNVARVLYEQAMLGNLEAIKIIFDRVDGKLSQIVEVDATQTVRHVRVSYEFADPLEVLSNRASLSAPIDHIPRTEEDP